MYRQLQYTLIAKWTPRNDTKYTVAYYVNSGNKDVNGDYIYTRANAVTKSYTGTTEDVVSVAAEELKLKVTCTTDFTAECTGSFSEFCIIPVITCYGRLLKVTILQELW